VHYGRLVDIGRGMLEEQVSRSPVEIVLRRMLRLFIPYAGRIRLALTIASPFKWLLPSSLRKKVPPLRTPHRPALAQHSRRMLVLDGCIQSVATPQTNDAMARILDKLGVTLVSTPKAGCCGGMSYHLGVHDEGLDFMRANIDAWWPEVENGTEAIIVSASGCGVTVKEYGELLAHDKQYADKAKRVSELACDPVEILANEDLSSLGAPGNGKRIAFHSPCTLQHGQSITGNAGGGCAPVLRLRGHLLDFAAGDFATVVEQQGRGTECRRPGNHRHCQCRLPVAYRYRSGCTGGALA